MTARRATWAWLALAALAVTCAAIVLTVYLVGDVPFLDDSLYIVSGLGPLGIGVLLVVHRPGNTVGRLLVVIGSAWTLGESARIHLWSSTHLGAIPGTDLAAWLLSWAFVPAWMLIAFVLAVFPSGRTATAWLRWPIRVGLAAVVMVSVVSMVSPVELDDHGEYLEGMTNPWAIEVLAAEGQPGDVVEILINGVFAVLVVVILVDLGVRWRRSAGAERLQMRWFGLGVAALVVVLGISAVLARLDPHASTLPEVATVALAINAVPVAIGVAVSRFRLYEIDRLLSRTFSYTLVAGLLAGVFAGTVLLLSNLLPFEGDIAVPASTLAAAALFNPLRKQILGRVDRRFNRSRYDAEQEIERFANRLRTELNLGDLTGEVLSVVTTTMQPTRASVWIREER